MPDGAAPVLDVRGLKTVFRTRSGEVHAVNDVSFALNKGELLGVVGESGSGKSVTMMSLLGLLPMPPAQIRGGQVLLDGHDLLQMAPKDLRRVRGAKVGFVFQDPMTGTAASMQIEENMALAARRGLSRTLKKGISSKEREFYRERLAELGLGLEDRMTSKVGLLSGGQRQALTLLMATLKKPQLLLLDEHTAALDPKTAAKVLEATDRIVGQDNLTTLMITHNMKDAIAHGNRLVMMYEGHIIYDVAGEEKKKLHVSDLLEKFEQASGGSFANDRMILS